MADTSGFGKCAVVPNWDGSRFFDFNGSCYDGEKILYSNRQAETENLFGIDAVYYKMSYNVDTDPLFKEDPRQFATRMFKFKATLQGDLPTMERRYALAGIYQDDVLAINANIMHFQMYSQLDYSTSATFPALESPMVGDFVYTAFNDMLWRIIFFTDADLGQYHEQQTSFTIKLRKWVNNHIAVKPEDGTNPEDFSLLDELIFREDIFKDNPKPLAKEKPKTLYKPRPTEKKAKNTPDNPFQGW